MSSLQHKHKINNSYESEPSSGSGSLSEHNEYHVSDISDEHMNLPYLLQPKPHVREETAAVMIADASDGVAKVAWQSPKEIRVQNKRELLYGVPLHSSQESSFEGFNDSPLDKMQRRFYSPEAKALKPTANCCMAQSDHTIRPSPGKIVFAKFYDTIVEENSCNAVDVQLSGESISQRSHYSSTGCGSNSQANPSSELSFNGRIKSLTSDATRTVPGLGRTKAEEVETDLHKLSKRLTGQVGLLFTEKSKKEVLDWAETYWAVEYARSGFVATETVELPEGPLEEFSHSMEPHLRSLGLPTKLQKGVVTLCSNYTVCEEGKSLTPEQARILKLIAKPMAKFRLTMKCSWTKSDGFELHVEDNLPDGNEEEKTDSGQGDEVDDEAMEQSDDDESEDEDE